MKRFAVLFLLLFGWGVRASALSDAQNVLLEQMATGHSWQRIHAAEGLLAAYSCVQEVCRQFKKELKESAPASPWRVGCLRVLYQTGLVDRSTIRNELLEICWDEKATGLVHAVETVGKLKLRLSAQECVRLKAYLTHEGMLRDYVLMVLAINGDSDSQVLLLKQLKAGNVTAAFAWFYMNHCSEDYQRALVAASEDASKRAVFRAFAFRARAKHHGYLAEDRLRLLKRIECEHDETAMRFYLLALGDFRRQEDVPYLSTWLKSDKISLRIAASSSLLRICHR